MASTERDRSLVVIQLSGGNDPLNTIVPYGDGEYHDFRKTVKIEEDEVVPIDGRLGFNPRMHSFKRLWDSGQLAVIAGIGYPSPNRSHFRSMDIWHTAEPTKVGDEGWLGRAIHELDPEHENVLTGVNFGRGLPRALGKRGVPVASVGNLETYGLYPDLTDEWLRKYALEAFAKMYGGERGRDAVMDFLGQTGNDALKGADILRTAPVKYESGVEYGGDGIGQSLRSVAQVMFADLGTRIYYAQHGGFDTHAGELVTHGKLWNEVDGAVGDFWDDLVEHDRADDTAVLVFTEFGRRIKDNGSGTDHGSGGVAFVIGGGVKGGLYGEYPSLKEEEQLEGDLHYNNDFRSTYSTLLEDWMGLEASPIVNGQFEHLGLFGNGGTGKQV